MADKGVIPVKEAPRALRRPFRTFFEDWDEDLNRWFDWPVLRHWPNWPETRLADWAPRMDAFEKGDKLIIKAELPGLQKPDIEVKLTDGSLVIKGERKTESEVKEENYYRKERSFGSFFRKLPLDFEVNAKDIRADFHDGVLEITIPKPRETAKAHKIEVH